MCVCVCFSGTLFFHLHFERPLFNRFPSNTGIDILNFILFLSTLGTESGDLWEEDVVISLRETEMLHILTSSMYILKEVYND